MNIYTANQYIKDTFGEKLYKLSLNAGTTCPNRDGTAGIGGCIFCSSLGSGDFSQKADMDIDRQIEQAKQLVASKFKGKHYIAYFQSFTNTSDIQTYICEALITPHRSLLTSELYPFHNWYQSHHGSDSPIDLWYCCQVP